MVKVLDATPDRSVVKEKICGHCGSKLEYVPRDIQERKAYDYTGDFDLVKYITCPTCTGEVMVSRW